MGRVLFSSSEKSALEKRPMPGKTVKRGDSSGDGEADSDGRTEVACREPDTGKRFCAKSGEFITIW